MKRTCFVAMQRQRRKVLNGRYAEERSAPDGSRKGTATRGAVETGTRLLEAVVTRNNTVSSIFLGYCLQSRHSDKLEARWPSFTSQNRWTPEIGVACLLKLAIFCVLCLHSPFFGLFFLTIFWGFLLILLWVFSLLFDFPYSYFFTQRNGLHAATHRWNLSNKGQG